MSTTQIGIVGCGRISRRHIEAIDATPGMELVAVCDSVPEKMELGLLKGRDIKRITDYHRLPELDAVAVCTPSGLHPSHAADIARTTPVSSIIVEKPISLTVRETVALFRQIDVAGKRLLPVYQNRYNPLVEFIKSIIDEGRLGTIYQFVVNVFWNRNDQYFDIGWHGTIDLDGGVFYTQASHYVDMLVYLFGDVAEAKGLGGRLRNLDVQDTISAVVHHANGAVGSLNCTISTYRRNYQTEFTVIGSKGTIRLQGTNLNTIEFWDVEGMEKPNMDFTLDHIYGKGHDFMYQYVRDQNWDRFPTRDEVLKGIALMERLSF